LRPISPNFSPFWARGRPQLLLITRLKWGLLLPYVKTLGPRSWANLIKTIKERERGVGIFRATLNPEAEPILLETNCTISNEFDLLKEKNL